MFVVLKYCLLQFYILLRTKFIAVGIDYTFKCGCLSGIGSHQIRVSLFFQKFIFFELLSREFKQKQELNLLYHRKLKILGKVLDLFSLSSQVHDL